MTFALRRCGNISNRCQPMKLLFIVEGGAEYHTKEDPFNYLMQHGAVTHDGRHIVLYPHPIEGVDGLSLSFYQLIDEAIERGKLELPELESDHL